MVLLLVCRVLVSGCVFTGLGVEVDWGKKEGGLVSLAGN
jgi:hypothetical protein